MKEIKILSWNILGPLAQDLACFINRYNEVKNWPKRFLIILNKILSYNPDIICLQEVDLAAAQQFSDALQEHGFRQSSYAARSDRGGVVIFHKTGVFEVIDSCAISLSGKQVLTSPGIYTQALLFCKETKKRFVVGSIHLHWQCVEE